MRKLHLCSHYGDAEGVLQILEKSDPFLVNYADQLGQTALHYAASAGRVAVTNVLLKIGANIDATDIDGGTPLSIACNKGSTKIVDLLLKFGADLEVKNHKGQTPLHCAAMSGAFGVFRLLVEFGANFNALSAQKRTPLDCPHLQCPTQNYFRVIERHLIKMASARLPYIKFDFYRPCVMDLGAKRAYRDECIAELNKLKAFKFPATSVSLLDFLTTPKSVHLYVRNPDIRKIVSFLDLTSEFPIYGRLIKHNLFKGLKRLGLIENARLFFSLSSSFSKLPLVCFEKVCRYLDDRTLSYLGLVCVWSQMPPSRRLNSGHSGSFSPVASSTEACSMAGIARLKVWSIVGLCLSRFMNPQSFNSLS